MAEAVNLSPEQIQNWRKILLGTIGPYALIMPDESVQILRDQYQKVIDDASGIPGKVKE